MTTFRPDREGPRRNLQQGAARWIHHVALITLMAVPLSCMARNADASGRTDPALVAAIRHFDDAAGQGRQYDTTHFVAAVVHLGHSLDDYAIVYISDHSGFWCGTGGCTLLVFKRHHDQWVVFSRTLITRAPICVMSRMDHGLHAIGVWEEGGGIQPGYMAVLPFDGKKYPASPVVAPAFPMKPQSACEVVIPSTAESEALY